ncbi:MAG: hypothetical protein K2O61_06540 [Bacteroidaceae bacterium]|nr:hypothetical protein [Bacteroidaceae bacterium]
MNDVSLIWITAAVGLGSSLITLIVTKIIDYRHEKKRLKRELFKLVFERKTNVVEKAMSWYQEALDNYFLLQMSCEAYQDGIENYAFNRLYIASQRVDNLFKEASIRLNSIYLYYDFSKIEEKNKSRESLEMMNNSINKIAVLVAKIQSDELDKETLEKAKCDLKELLLSLSDSLNSQIDTILEIQRVLREDYKITM